MQSSLDPEMNGHLSKILPRLVEHLHLKTNILRIYFWSTQGQHGLLRHLALGRLQTLYLLGRGRLDLGGRGRRHLLGQGRQHLLGLGGRGRRASSESVGGGGGTSSFPRFLDGSLDAMRLLEEEALGFTSW
jgi:hypothetical protein